MKINNELLNNQYFNQALENLFKVLKIASVQSEPIPGAIFGIKTRESLEFTLNLAKEWGLKTYIESEGYYGYIEYGHGKEIFLIATHLDVVEIQNFEEWINNPFEPKIIDNKIFARGINDNKGPAYMSLYALKYLIDQNWQSNNYTIRIVFGLDEENEMRCLKKYVEDFGPPSLGFTPDGFFPCVYAEKGICYLNLTGNFNCDFTIKKNSKDSKDNSVLNQVVYSGKNIDKIIDFLDLYKIKSKINKNELIIFNKAIQNKIEINVNPVIWLFKALDSIGVKHPLIQFCSKYLSNNFSLKEIVGDLTDESGSLTTRLDYIEINKDRFILGLNNRVPVTKLDQKDLIPPLEECANLDNIRVKIKKSLAPVYFKKDRFIVKKMVEIYKRVTNNSIEPIAMGGSTYAKVVPNIISCGVFEGFSNLSAHKSNEWISIDNLKTALEIYTNIIFELTL